MKKNHFISGEWNLTCDVCSKKIKAHEAHHRWDGFIVCQDDFEMRHEQDFVKAKTDKITVPFQRPIPTEVFAFACTVWTSQGIADQGVADCAQADRDLQLVWEDWAGSVCSIEQRYAYPTDAIAGCAIAGRI